MGVTDVVTLRFSQYGQMIYAPAIIGIGAETLICARGGQVVAPLTARIIPVIPWVPANSFIAYLCGLFLVMGGIWLLMPVYNRTGAIVIGATMFLGALAFDVPASLSHIHGISLRTRALEPIAIASLAWMLPASGRAWPPVSQICGRIFGVCLLIFGVDHFIAAPFIATLIPFWIPWHGFWVYFFGSAFIAAGASFITGAGRRLAACLTGTMFAIWVLTLHVPRTFGAYDIPRAYLDPNEWSSLFIALALCGGSWAVAANLRVQITNDNRQRSSSSPSDVSR